MSEKETKNDPLLEESSVLSNSPLQGIHQGKDEFGQTAQVPDKYILIHVSVYICVSVEEKHPFNSSKFVGRHNICNE